jgi:tetratricopeptide (TPR) repeat protein
MADIFVSYAREDQPRAEAFVNMLESQGWSVWWDREIGPGSAFSKVIENEILAAKCVIVLWTRHSVNSDWVHAEASEGLTLQKLIPVLMEKVEVPLVFRMRQASDLSGWPDRASEAEVQGLLNAVSEAIERPVILPAPPGKRRTTMYMLLAAIAVAGAVGWFSLPDEQTPAERADATDSLAPVSIRVEPFNNTREDIASDIKEQLARNNRVRVRDQDPEFTLRGMQREDKLLVSLFDNQNQQTRFSFEIDLDNVSAYQAMREVVYRTQKEFDETISRSPQQIPNDVYLEYLAVQSDLRRYKDQQRRPELRERLESIIEKAPRFSEAIAALCNLEINEYQDTGISAAFTRAERLCLRAARLDKDNPTVQTYLGTLYLQGGQLADAEQSFHAALETSKFSTAAMEGLARVLAARDELDDAEAVMKQAQSLEPEKWNLYFSLGRIFFTHGQFEAAAKQYEQAVALAPEESVLYNDLGSSYFMIEEFGKAIEYWERSLSQQPNYAALSNLASAYYFDREFDKAVDAYQQAIAINNSDYRLWLNTGEAAFHSENHEARGFYEKCIELGEPRLAVNPDDTEVLSALALANASVGEDGRATDFIERALEKGGNDIYVLYDIAVAYSRLGETGRRDEVLGRMVASGYSNTLIAKDANFD